jgi:hypothetical protein
MIETADCPTTGVTQPANCATQATVGPVDVSPGKPEVATGLVGDVMGVAAGDEAGAVGVAGMVGAGPSAREVGFGFGVGLLRRFAAGDIVTTAGSAYGTIAEEPVGGGLLACASRMSPPPPPITIDPTTTAVTTFGCFTFCLSDAPEFPPSYYTLSEGLKGREQKRKDPPMRGDYWGEFCA